MLLKITAVAAGSLVLVACGHAQRPAVATSASDLPPGCMVKEVDGIVTSFLVQPQLAPPEMFQVYATYESDGGRYVTRTRIAALAHARARRAAGERLRLVSLRVRPQDVNHVRITFELTRFAPDFRTRKLHGRVANGAGTIDCAHQKVAAWVVKGP